MNVGRVHVSYVMGLLVTMDHVELMTVAIAIPVDRYVISVEN